MNTLLRRVATTILALPLLASSAMAATSLEAAVGQALKHHPRVSSAQANARAAAAEVRRARAAYYPTLDVIGSLGKEHSDIESLNTSGNPKNNLWRKDVNLTLSMNLFDGNAKQSNVERQSALSEVAQSAVTDSREATALEAVQVFVDVLRSRELVALAEKNVRLHRETQEKIGKRVKQGVGQKANLQQVQARLALALSTLTQREGDRDRAISRYLRVVGEMPADLDKPAEQHSQFIQTGELDREKYDWTVSEALDAALLGSPSMKTAQANLAAAEAAVGTSRAAYYPTVDVELKVDRNNNVSGVEGHRNTEALMLVARWNLYRGGADEAAEKAAVEQHMAAKDELRDTRLALEEGVALALRAKATSELKLQYLNQHVDASQQTRDAYAAQFDLGKRTLLDVLNAENELFTAQSNLRRGQYDDIFNGYLVMASQGRLVPSLQLSDRTD